MLESTRKYARATPIVTLWFICLSLILVACRGAGRESAATADFEATVATAWFDLQLTLIQMTPGFSPPVAARALGYSGVTLYEAVIPGMPEHQSLVGQLNELEALPQPEPDVAYHWPTVANSALASITRKLFATASSRHMEEIAALEEQLYQELTADLPPELVSRSKIHGQLLAEAIYVWSLGDRGHAGVVTNFPASYTPVVGVGMWESTPPGFSPALQPYWGSNRPFVLNPIVVCDPGPPPEYDTAPDSAFYQEALEVYQTVQNLTEAQRMIALFWADDPGQTATPPGHWVSIVNQIVAEHNFALDVAAEAYARVGIAAADAFISCWNTKYRYNLLRPITYIQQLIDPGWNADEITDPVITPPFPEYTSGHSVQSGAVAAVLTDLFGPDFAFTDRTHEALGYPPRSFNSFYEAAEEAAISRLYGGIHYRMAIELGVEQGKCVGERVNAIQFRKEQVAGP